MTHPPIDPDELEKRLGWVRDALDEEYPFAALAPTPADACYYLLHRLKNGFVISDKRRAELALPQSELDYRIGLLRGLFERAIPHVVRQPNPQDGKKMLIDFLEDYIAFEAVVADAKIAFGEAAP